MNILITIYRNPNEIQTLFSSTEAKIDISKPKERTVEIKPKLIQIVDSRRQQNVAIVLKRIRLPAEDIKTALLKCDDIILSVENLQFLQKIIPTSDETVMLKAY